MILNLFFFKRVSLYKYSAQNLIWDKVGDQFYNLIKY